ncbi:MAG: hypothetical protein HDR36_00050 [Treponema sp.]|nr:hypothetical protein [Treponema sp.]MBD5434906.1 hypothetical protein [Treponema sp.]MBD5438882.1 hypothetical protein [Treponema sp.]MBD5439522.1 hypothetical protein [Treponema sp.]MDE6068878.1 hypothetical protein [Treponemataceae bacterium]
MKKIFVVFAVAMLSAFAFAQDDGGASLDMSVQTIVPEDQHVQNKTAQVRIEYTEGLDEVRIYYTCLEVSFKEDEARETIHQCLNDFMIQKGYLSYKYLKQDRTSYKKDSRGLKRATYMSHVKFLDRTRNKFDVVSEDQE